VTERIATGLNFPAHGRFLSIGIRRSETGKPDDPGGTFPNGVDNSRRFLEAFEDRIGKIRGIVYIPRPFNAGRQSLSSNGRRAIDSTPVSDLPARNFTLAVTHAAPNHPK